MGELMEKDKGVIAFSWVSGRLDGKPLPAEFNNLHTKGYNENTCKVDGDSIHRQILKDGSVTTVDGRIFDILESPGGDDQIRCDGSAYKSLRMYPPVFVCSLTWEKGNWGKTLSCN